MTVYSIFFIDFDVKKRREYKTIFLRVDSSRKKEARHYNTPPKFMETLTVNGWILFEKAPADNIPLTNAPRSDINWGQ